MIGKLKELPLLSATFVFVIVVAIGAFATGCGSDTDDHSEDSTAAGDDDHDAADGDTHEDDEDDDDHHDDDDDDHADVGESNVSAGSFGDVAAVWAEVLTLKTELDGLIASKDLLKVHEAAFAVRDHVNLMTDKSQDLTAGKQADLARGIRTVASLAAELDEAGDSENQEETEALNKRLQTVLDAIAAIYPEGALK